MDRNIGFIIPSLALPCGENIGLTLDVVSKLRAAGINQVHFEACHHCGAEHLIPLPDLSTVEVQVMSPLVQGLKTYNRRK